MRAIYEVIKNFHHVHPSSGYCHQGFGAIFELKIIKMESEDKKWYRASLRLSGDSLPIDEIESKLELKASSIGKKGFSLNRYKSPILNESLKTNVWCAEKLTENNVPLENQIELYLEKLEPKKEVLKRAQSPPRTRAAQ